MRGRIPLQNNDNMRRLEGEIIYTTQIDKQYKWVGNQPNLHSGDPYLIENLKIGWLRTSEFRESLRTQQRGCWRLADIRTKALIR